MFILFLLSGACALLSAFMLGCCSSNAKVLRLQKENQQLRDILDKVFYLEKLGTQTYSKVTCDLVAMYAEAQRDTQNRK